MAEIKKIKKYYFSVEGKTEKWYLDWLQSKINESSDSDFRVKISCKVTQNPKDYVKTIPPILSTIKITHWCDIESNSEEHEKKFYAILNQLNSSNGIGGVKYKLGYCNLTFELWMVLHISDCSSCYTDRSQYIVPINNAFKEHFLCLSQYKDENNFKTCLGDLSLTNVIEAIKRAEKIMGNKDIGYELIKYKGYSYYKDNPSLTIWESIKAILSDCHLM